jgi:polyribonucleotide nucleotidyltransferase
MQINPEKIKEVIWKGWDVINKIIENCGWSIKIDFEDDGKVFLTHQDADVINKAIWYITDIVTDLEAWQEFEAVVTRVEDYWVFVQLPKNKMWLCHVSNLGQRYATPLSNHFKVWEKMHVKIKWIDHDGKIAVLKI